MMNRRVFLGTGILLFVLALAACTPDPVEEPAPTEEANTSPLCAIVWTPYYSSGSNYLGVVDSVPCLNAFELVILFEEPVDSVGLSFSGADTSYVIDIYDGSGILLHSQVAQAQFNEGDGTLVTIGYTSESTNIMSVHFSGPRGGPKVVIAVREIFFSIAGTETRYDFDAFPDGTIITGDTQDTQGRTYLGLTGNEFMDWGFTVSTDLGQP